MLAGGLHGGDAPELDLAQGSLGFPFFDGDAWFGMWREMHGVGIGGLLARGCGAQHVGGVMFATIAKVMS
jgi:hypothetical protein